MRVILTVAVIGATTSISFSQCVVSAGKDTSVFCGGAVQLNAERSWDHTAFSGWNHGISVFFTDTETGYMVAYKSFPVQEMVTLKTTNGGVDWMVVDSTEYEEFQSVYFTSDNEGFVAGRWHIKHTEDAGATWTIQQSGTYKLPHQIFFINSEVGYIVGDSGTIIKTMDGGTNWLIQQSGTPNILYSVYFVDENTGFATGQGGIILKTTDGGINWAIKDAGNIFELNSVYFTDAATGYVCGYDYANSIGIVLKTTDGGDHWTLYNTSVPYMLLSLTFTDATTGYIVGYAGTILKTTNAGTDWTVVCTNEYKGYYSVFFPDAGTGYAVGGQDASNIGTMSKLSLSGNTFSWSPTEGLSAPNIPNPIASPGVSTQYTVTMTTPENCTTTDSVEILVAPMNSPDICIVGVNGFNKNMITWEIPATAAIDSFYLFRESTATGIYQKIGSISANEPGVFTDTASHPEIQSNKYRLSLSDTCGFETEQGTPHKTMHLAINKGQDSTWNLIWEPYEGFEVSTYYIYRGTSTSNLQLIGSTSGSSSQYSDFTAPSGYVYYQVEVINPNPCGYSKNPLPTSRSNIATNNPLWITDLQHSQLNIRIIPNPATVDAVVEIQGYNADKEPVLEILNLTGQVIKQVEVRGSKTRLNLTDLPCGAYLVKVVQTDAVGFTRMIKY